MGRCPVGGGGASPAPPAPKPGRIPGASRARRMRTTALPRTHRRTRPGAPPGGTTRTLRTLEDRLATLRHDRTRRRGSRCRTHRRSVNRTRSGLRNDQTALRSRRSCAGCRTEQAARTRVRRSRSSRTPARHCAGRGGTRRQLPELAGAAGAAVSRLRSVDCRHFWRCNLVSRLHRDRMVFDCTAVSDRLASASSAAGRSGTGGFGGMTTAAGGRATDCGVMKRGAGFGGSAGAAGCALAVTGSGRLRRRRRRGEPEERRRRTGRGGAAG